jgi:hypothetical protein
MKSKPLLLCLLCLACLSLPGLALPPSTEPENPEAKFVPDLGYRNWQGLRKKLDDAAGDLNGSQPVKSIRVEILKTVKDTHSFMKSINELDAREAISVQKKDDFKQQANMLAGRFEALAESLSSASISPDASPKQRMQWQETRKEALAQLDGAQVMLDDTATSLEQMSTEE